MSDEHEYECKECPQCGGEMIPFFDMYGGGVTCPDISCDGYTEWDEDDA